MVAKLKKPDSVSLEFNIFFFKAILKWEKSKEELEKKEKELREKLEEIKKREKSAENWWVGYKEIAEEYVSLYSHERMLLTEVLESLRRNEKMMKNFYESFREDYKKISCPKCWEKHEFLWKIKTKELNEKQTKEYKNCRRCSRTAYFEYIARNTKKGEIIKNNFRLEIADDYFKNLCNNCFDVLENIIFTFTNYKGAEKETIVGMMGIWWFDTQERKIKVWEGGKTWEFILESQSLSDILKLMNF